MDFLLYIISGAAVGFAVGLTGVGGGSLMTPLLLLFGFPPPVAIGTDLLYAGLTKASGAWFQHLKGNIQWRVVLLLGAGSIPMSLLLNLFIFDESFRNQEGFEVLLTTTLGVMLVVTSLVIVCHDLIRRRREVLMAAVTQNESPAETDSLPGYAGWATVLVGVVLGVCVTLSSVGAGAFGAAVLFMLYPHLKANTIVGTDIAHAVPLTLVAGLGYLINGLVDLQLLLALLCGSLPGIYLGTQMGSILPERLMRWLLAILLLILGVNFSLGAVIH